MHVRRLALGLVCLVSIAGLAVACGSSSDNNAAGSGGNGAAGGGNSGGSGGGTAGSNSGGSSGSGGFTSTGGSSGSSSGGNAGASSGGSSGSTGSGGGAQDADLDVGFVYDGPVDDGGFNQDASCAAATAEAKPLPLDMYVMLDQSGSMGTDCDVNTTTYQASAASKWCYAVNALYGFMATANPALDQRVAIQYFGLNGDSCNGADYQTPEINLTAVPSGAASFVNSLNSHQPSTNTPTLGAIKGLTAFTAARKAADPTRTIVGILITDGDPNTCTGGGPAGVGNVITNAWAGGAGVRTYVIGMTGATFANLETMAQGGGAPAHSTYCGGGAASCHYYNVGNGDFNTFSAVLSTIQASALGCDYNMPTTDAGVIDPGKVSVQYYPSGNPPAATIPKVSSASQCPAPNSGQGGWYYDNNTNPTKITLCPATCSVVQSDSKAKVDVNLGCLGS